MWAQIGGLQKVEMDEEILSGGVKKEVTGTHGSQRLDQLFTLLGGSFLSEIHARTTKCTAISDPSAMVTWYGSGGWFRGHSS